MNIYLLGVLVVHIAGLVRISAAAEIIIYAAQIDNVIENGILIHSRRDKNCTTGIYMGIPARIDGALPRFHPVGGINFIR